MAGSLRWFLWKCPPDTQVWNQGYPSSFHVKMVFNKMTSLAHNSVTLVLPWNSHHALASRRALRIFSVLKQRLRKVNIHWLWLNKMYNLYCLITIILEWNRLLYCEYRVVRKTRGYHCRVMSLLCLVLRSRGPHTALWEPLIEINVLNTLLSLF